MMAFITLCSKNTPQMQSQSISAPLLSVFFFIATTTPFITAIAQPRGWGRGRMAIGASLWCKSVLLCAVAVLLLVVQGGAAVAQSRRDASNIQELKLDWDKDSGILSLSTVVPLKLAPDIHEALEKGLSVVFVAHTELKRKRWWAWDPIIDSTWRSYRLSYTPLSRQWTVRVSSGTGEPVVRDRGIGLPLRFDTLSAALEAMSRINFWRFATADQLSSDADYVLRFSFEISTSQLPRPLQIGLIGENAWRWNWQKVEPFRLEALR